MGYSSFVSDTSVASLVNTTLTALSEQLEPLHTPIRHVGILYDLPWHFLVAGHAVTTSASFRSMPIRSNWLLSFWLCVISGYGGGTITAIILPASFIWLRDDLILPIFAIAWWFMTYSPGDFGFKLFNLLPVKLLCRCCAAICRALVMFTRIDNAFSKFGPSAVSGPLFIGTVSGFGGKLIVDLTATLMILPQPTLPELLHPTWLFRSAFLITLFYSAASHWSNFLPRDVAFSITASVLVCHAIVETVTGTKWDPTRSLANAFHRLTGIPSPDSTVASVAATGPAATNGAVYRPGGMPEGKLEGKKEK